jgi:hypothetical protein
MRGEPFFTRSRRRRSHHGGMATHFIPDTTRTAAHAPSLSRVRAALRDRRTSPRARARLAATYESLLVTRPHRATALTAQVPVQHAAVAAAELELRAIASRLRAVPCPPEPGVRAARRLVTDGAGPVYAPAERDRLRVEAARVLAQLR